MASPRRIGASDAKNRVVLLDAAEKLLLDEGYAAVTSRRVARVAGLKPQLVHYYFRTMDDLFIAVYRRRADEGLARHVEALTAPNPLRAAWDFASGGDNAAFTLEFTALARHRPAVRQEVARYAELFRAAQIEVVRKIIEQHDIDPSAYPPLASAVVLTGIAQVIAMDRGLGISTGHAETIALVDGYLQQQADALDGADRRAPRPD
jgi:TetR/AcrR family transcriptional regulator